MVKMSPFCAKKAYSRSVGISPPILTLTQDAIKALYEGSSSKIKIGNLITKGFKVTKGLRQGCSLSPTLFKIHLERVLRNWKRKCQPMGIPVQNTHVYSILQTTRY
jgi:hypothetical protein